MIFLFCLIGLLAIVGVIVWFDHKRRFFLDPDNAPPAFGPEPPHGFVPYHHQDVPACGLCGGGKNHSVHHGVRWVPKPEHIKSKYLK